MTTKWFKLPFNLIILLLIKPQALPSSTIRVFSTSRVFDWKSASQKLRQQRFNLGESCPRWLRLCLHELLQLSCTVEGHYFNRKFSIGCKGMPDKILAFIDMKIFPNNLAFPSQTSKMQMVEQISKVEVVSLDCAAHLKSLV